VWNDSVWGSLITLISRRGHDGLLTPTPRRGMVQG